ncbi:cell division protein PerM [Glaciibacter sp. 2TAF33]|uniref:cell division protein PerM n=1 Tax=Glaciibacter sp. 2TAF33 TaxID=3233015 RepID=UPI003F8EE7BC
MNRITTALLAALEALIVVAIGVGIALVPLTVLWATHFGLAIDWFVSWRAAVDVWLLGNGVDLLVQLDPATVAALGLPGAEAPFWITTALLGFALLAVLLGVRTGARASETPHPIVGMVAGVATYGVLATLLTFSAGDAVVRPAHAQGVLLPTGIFAVGVVIGAVVAGVRRAARTPESAGSGSGAGPGFGSAVGTGIGSARASGSGPGAGDRLDPVTRGIRRRYLALPADQRAGVAGALRGGTAAVAGVMAASGIAVAVIILANYATIIGLYEALQAGVMGGITLTLAQLALIPNLVIWAASWFVGPGIAVGVGTSVSPVGTVLGPVPGLPIFGALPHGSLAIGFLGLIVPVVVGFACAVVIRQRMHRPGIPQPSLRLQLATGLGMGVVAGVLLGLLAWWSAGAMGPGRLADVGPNPLLVGALAFVEIGIAACVGMLAGYRRDQR